MKGKDLSAHKILQIIPAEGWYAKYRWEPEGYETTNPLTCWCLVEWTNEKIEKPWRTVEGYECDGDEGALCIIYEAFVEYTRTPIVEEEETK